MMDARILIPFRRVPVYWAALALVGSSFFSGCGGSDVGTAVQMAPGDRPDWDDSTPATGKMTIPGDAAFNYPKFRSGQEGSGARGDAVPIGNNGASCRAELGGEGAAWGEFHLGYCLDNMTGGPLEAVIRLRLTIQESITHNRAGAETAEATGNVIFFIKDSYPGQIIKQENLVSSNLDKGPRSSTRPYDLVFDARLAPDRGYYLIVAGRADVKSQGSDSVAIALEVKDLSMEISWRPADASAEAKSASAAAPVQAVADAVESSVPAAP